MNPDQSNPNQSNPDPEIDLFKDFAQDWMEDSNQTLPDPSDNKIMNPNQSNPDSEIDLFKDFAQDWMEDSNQTLPDPSDKIQDLRDAKAKLRRFFKVLKRTPKKGEFAQTSKGQEQWTAQDRSYYNEYNKQQRKGEFLKPLSLIEPSTNPDVLRDANAKIGRFLKVLKRTPKEGEFVQTSKGQEQWTAQDRSNYNEYDREINKKKRKAAIFSNSVGAESNANLPVDLNAFMSAGNSGIKPVGIYQAPKKDQKQSSKKHPKL